MRARQPKPAHVPRLWLMADARIASDLPRIIAAMPARSAVVVRPYALGNAGKEASLRPLRRIALAKRHLLLLAGPGDDRAYHGRHGFRGHAKSTPVSAPVHNRRDSERARKAGVAIVLISPVYGTRSHQDARPIGRRGFGSLAAQTRGLAIALGGMDAERFRKLRNDGAHGWAAIDAFARDQKRNWVPT